MSAAANPPDAAPHKDDSRGEGSPPEQSINQPTNQSINQSIYQSNNLNNNHLFSLKANIHNVNISIYLRIK